MLLGRVKAKELRRTSVGGLLAQVPLTRSAPLTPHPGRTKSSCNASAFVLPFSHHSITIHGTRHSPVSSFPFVLTKPLPSLKPTSATNVRNQRPQPSSATPITFRSFSRPARQWVRISPTQIYRVQVPQETAKTKRTQRKTSPNTNLLHSLLPASAAGREKLPAPTRPQNFRWSIPPLDAN